MTRSYDIHWTFVLHGVADRDPNELVCMYFPTLEQAQAFPAQLPGRYNIQMVENLDYDAINVETIDQIGGEDEDEPDQVSVITLRVAHHSPLDVSEHRLHEALDLSADERVDVIDVDTEEVGDES